MRKLSHDDKVKLTLAGVLAAGVVGSLLWMAGLSPVEGQYTALAPFQTNLTIGTGATTAAVPANPSRRGLVICNGHASQSVTIGFGSNTPVSGTSGLVIPGGNVVASCWYAMPNFLASPIVGVGAQLNMIASGASTPVTVLEF